MNLETHRLKLINFEKAEMVSYLYMKHLERQYWSDMALQN